MLPVRWQALHVLANMWASRILTPKLSLLFGDLRNVLRMVLRGSELEYIPSPAPAHIVSRLSLHTVETRLSALTRDNHPLFWEYESKQGMTATPTAPVLRKPRQKLLSLQDQLIISQNAEGLANSLIEAEANSFWMVAALPEQSCILSNGIVPVRSLGVCPWWRFFFNAKIPPF